MSEIAKPSADDPVIDDAALKKAEEFIEEEEGASNKLRGALGVFAAAVAIVMSLFHLYTAYAIVPTQVLRPVHVGFVLFLSYLLFPVSRRYRHRIMWWDWVAAFAAVAVIAYILHGGDDIWDRNTSRKARAARRRAPSGSRDCARPGPRRRSWSSPSSSTRSSASSFPDPGRIAATRSAGWSGICT